VCSSRCVVVGCVQAVEQWLTQGHVMWPCQYSTPERDLLVGR
jgi:hypothetical protein